MLLNLELCRKTLKEEDATEEEIDAELGIIRAQMGYVYQVMGKRDLALRLYNQVLKQRPDDVALVAVASNNVVTINKDQNVFDSKKRMRAALSEATDTKLSSWQRKTISLNNCLLLVNTNQYEACRGGIQAFKAKFPEAVAEAILLEAALLSKEKHEKKAIEVLRKFRPSGGEPSLELSLTLAQLLVGQGSLKEATEAIQELKAPLANKLGIVSTLVSLFLALEDRSAVINVLENAINWHKKNKVKV